MIAASLYITACSFKNRVRVRLRRLREPRYLFGAIVGAAYLYFAVITRFTRAGVRTRRRRGSPPSFGDAIPAMQIAGTSLAGLATFVVAVLAWLLPMRSGLLEFSDAERDVLFAAPVSRRQLLVHRVVRSQVGALIAALFIALFATPLSGLSRVRFAVGMWVLLVTVRVYFAAVTLTRARLRSPDAAIRRGGWAAVAVVLAAVAVVCASVAPQIVQPAASATDFFVPVSRATSTAPTFAILWPFIAMLRPETTLSSFPSAIAGSVFVFAVVCAWMLLSDATLDDVAGEGKATVQAASRAPTAGRVGWTLALEGRLEPALLWKGAMATFRAGNVRSWRLLPPLIGVTIGVLGAAVGIMGGSNMQGAAAFATIAGCVIGGAATLIGPLMMREDLRTDFEHLDLLKTWPTRAAEVIRGEIVWPVLVVSAIACTALLVAAACSGTAMPQVGFVERWSVAIALLFAAPALIAAQYVVHNAAAIFFPAWVQLGSQRARGIDAMGQRLIMLVAIVVALVLFAVPAAAVSFVLWFVFRRLIGIVAIVPSAMLFAAIVIVEVLVVTELLGPAYDRIDLSSIERGE